MHIIWLGPCCTFFAANRRPLSCGAWRAGERAGVSAGSDDREPASRGWNRRKRGGFVGRSPRGAVGHVPSRCIQFPVGRLLLAAGKGPVPEMAGIIRQALRAKNALDHSRAPQFAAKLRDVVGLYVDPPSHAVVLSVDEKSQIQALDRTPPGLPMNSSANSTSAHSRIARCRAAKTLGPRTCMRDFDVKLISPCRPPLMVLMDALERPSGRQAAARHDAMDVRVMAPTPIMGDGKDSCQIFTQVCDLDDKPGSDETPARSLNPADFAVCGPLFSRPCAALRARALI